MRIILTTFSVVTLAISTVAQNLDSVKTLLEQDYRTSLSLRQNVMQTIKTFGYKSKEMDSLNCVIQHFDSLALRRTINILETYGWLGKSEIGFVANQTLYLTIQHADKSHREKYYPLLETSAKNGESNLFDMATMKDRILVDNGKQQIYGTQKDNEGRFYPIADIKGLNKRRRQVGLEALKVNDGDLRTIQN